MNERYDTAIFFDNLKSHVSRIGRSCSGRIESVHVGGTSGDPQIVPFTNERFRDLYLRLGYNSYLDFVRQYSPDGDAYDPSSGIKSKDLEIFDRWLEQTNIIQKRAMFLDWDRTITLFEGIAVGYLRDRSIPFQDLFPQVSIEDCLIYLCGGRSRLNMIRSMLRKAMEFNVDTYILTNNTACSYRFFKDIVDGLFGGQLRIICSGDAPYYGNKVKAIRRYMSNCSISSQRQRTLRKRTPMRSITSRRTFSGGKRTKRFKFI